MAVNYLYNIFTMDLYGRLFKAKRSVHHGPSYTTLAATYSNFFFLSFRDQVFKYTQLFFSNFF